MKATPDLQATTRNIGQPQVVAPVERLRVLSPRRALHPILRNGHVADLGPTQVGDSSIRVSYGWTPARWTRTKAGGP